MADCRKCRQQLPFFTIRDERHPNPLGAGFLCKTCAQPYRLVLKTYTINLKKAATDPKAAAWLALCCLAAAQRVNLVRTVTAALVGRTETLNSWEVCRQKAMALTAKALSMFDADAEGRVFLEALFALTQKITASPPRKIPIQRYASVMGDTILDIEYEAIQHSGLSMDELKSLALSMPGHEWLLTQNPDHFCSK